MKLKFLQVVENMERETRIELATNSLEGCDSTIELLPLNLVTKPEPLHCNRRRFEGSNVSSCLRVAASSWGDRLLA